VFSRFTACEINLVPDRDVVAFCLAAIQRVVRVRFAYHVSPGSHTRSARFPFSTQRLILIAANLANPARAGSRQRTLEEEKTVTGTQRIGTCGIVTVGVVSSGVALISSSLDRALFCILSSGSMLLALTIASASLDLFFRGLVRLGNGQAEKSAAHVSELAAAPGSNGRNSLRDSAAAPSVGD
jgi:hypothetical protein